MNCISGKQEEFSTLSFFFERNCRKEKMQQSPYYLNVHKEQYGIDPRDTYNVEQSIYEYIYCILMEYRKQATIINLHFHTVEYNGITWYKDEIIDRVLNALKQWLLFRNEDYPFYLGTPIEDELKDSLHLFIEIMECMWW